MRAAGDVGADLRPDVALRAAAEQEQRGRAGAELGEAIDDVAHRVRARLEDRAREVAGAVRRGQPRPRAARRRVPFRRHRARQRGQERDAVGAGRDRAGQRVDLGGVADPADVAQPLDGAARKPARVLDEPAARRVGVGLDQTAAIDQRARRERADHLGGAEHADGGARRDQPGAERRGEVVAGADRDRGPDR